MFSSNSTKLKPEKIFTHVIKLPFMGCILFRWWSFYNWRKLQSGKKKELQQTLAMCGTAYTQWWVCLVLHSKLVSVGLVCCTLQLNSRGRNGTVPKKQQSLQFGPCGYKWADRCRYSRYSNHLCVKMLSLCRGSWFAIRKIEITRLLLINPFLLLWLLIN